MTYLKRALKREPGYPVGVSAPMYLDCECGHHLSLPEVKGLPMTYVCVCGREYDSRGWIVRTGLPTAKDLDAVAEEERIRKATCHA